MAIQNPTAGQIFTVTHKKGMPAQRESNGRHATVPNGTQIVILEPAPGPLWVWFYVERQDIRERFSTKPKLIEECCTELLERE
jgi:hypothetical protein